MGDPTLIVQELRSHLGANVLESFAIGSDAVGIVVSPKDLPAAASVIDRTLDARFVISVGTDMREQGQGFRVDHIFSQDRRKTWVVLRTQTPADDPTVASITPAVPAAAWAEREFQDLVGITAAGHPDPRRLVLADDWPEGMHPLRRDFPYNFRPEPVANAAQPLAAPPGHSVTVPIGPFFPVLEEPVFIKVFVEGEDVVGLDYRGFFSHRGIEKLGDSKLTYNEIPFVAERICGICGFVHSTSYVQAVENAGEIEVPLRAKYIRSIVLELERVHSHLLWLGIAGHILGFDTVLMQTLAHSRAGHVVDGKAHRQPQDLWHEPDRRRAARHPQGDASRDPHGPGRNRTGVCQGPLRRPRRYPASDAALPRWACSVRRMPARSARWVRPAAAPTSRSTSASIIPTPPSTGSR